MTGRDQAAAQPRDGDVQFELRIEQRSSWGGMKWWGNFTERRWRQVCGEWGWSLGIEPVDGWWSWSRKRLEKKLRRQVERRRRELAWSAQRQTERITL